MSFFLQNKSRTGEGTSEKVTLERYDNLSNLNLTLKKTLHAEIDALLKSCWGAFPKDFIDHHIFRADKMMVARIEGKCVGVCIMSIKNINGLIIHYVEFLLVDKQYQKGGLGSHLFFVMIRREVLRNFISLISGKPLEIFFITPNIRVLAMTAKFASFIYPNPYESDLELNIKPADDQTWTIANEILKQSDNPLRKLERTGLVLHDSYASTPWLVYNNDTAPWHADEQLNIFAKKYLGYHHGEDKEFIVRAHINLFSLVKYILKV